MPQGRKQIYHIFTLRWNKDLRSAFSSTSIPPSVLLLLHPSSPRSIFFPLLLSFSFLSLMLSLNAIYDTEIYFYAYFHFRINISFLHIIQLYGMDVSPLGDEYATVGDDGVLKICSITQKV